MNWLSERNDFCVKSSCRLHISSHIIVDLIFQKWSETVSFFFKMIFMWNRAVASVSCAFCGPHLEKVVKRPSVLLTTIFMWKRALAKLQSHAHFVRPHLENVVRPCQLFSRFFMWNRALAAVSCAFCRPLSGSRCETAETETLQRRPRTGILPEKTQGFAAWESFHVPRSLTLWLDDDVIDMMVDWHDDWDDDVVAMMVRQLAIDNRP